MFGVELFQQMNIVGSIKTRFRICMEFAVVKRKELLPAVEGKALYKNVLSLVRHFFFFSVFRNVRNKHNF